MRAVGVGVDAQEPGSVPQHPLHGQDPVGGHPPQQIGTAAGEGPPHWNAEELPVRQDHFAGPAGAWQAAHQGHFAGAATGQLRIQHEMGAHLDQTGHPHVGKTGLVLAAAVSRSAEGGLVGRAVGHVPAGAVHRQQPQPPPEGARGGLGAHRLRGRGKQHSQRLRTQPLTGPKQRRLRRDVPVAQKSLAPQALDQVPHHLQIRRRREQGQGEHKVDHQPGRQQTSAMLRTTTGSHHTIHQPGPIHPGQQP